MTWHPLPSYYPDQCWLTVSRKFGNKLQWNTEHSYFCWKKCSWKCHLNGGWMATTELSDGSILDQVMARRRQTLRHYLTQWWSHSKWERGIYYFHGTLTSSRSYMTLRDENGDGSPFFSAQSSRKESQVIGSSSKSSSSRTECLAGNVWKTILKIQHEKLTLFAWGLRPFTQMVHELKIQIFKNLENIFTNGLTWASQIHHLSRVQGLNH